MYDFNCDVPHTNASVADHPKRIWPVMFGAFVFALKLQYEMNVAMR